MPKLKNVFLQFIAAVNNNANYTLNTQNNSSIVTRIEDVLSMTPAHILQKLNATTFDKEIKQHENKRNIKNKIIVSIFKAFLQFSKEEQMTIQKFLYCSCFDKIVEYMTPEQKVETCKHISRYIETIQNSINTIIESRKRKSKKRKSAILPTKEAPENTRNTQGLIQTLKKYTAITKPTEDNTERISTTLGQLQQKTITFLAYDAESVFINTLYETLNIGKLDKIGAPVTTTQTLLRHKRKTKDTQAKQPETTTAKKIQVVQAIKEIQVTAKKIKEERKRKGINEMDKIKHRKQIDEALKKQEGKPIVKTRKTAQTKARYQIISLTYDTPHKKELKEQYIKDNPEITKHTLYPILEAIHNYIYEENETKQKSEQNTTKQEKKQISALAVAHNTVPIGHQQCLEFYKQVNELQTRAQNTPEYIVRHLYRILRNNLSLALENLCGSASIHQIIELHLVHGKNPNKLSAFLQSIFDLDQKIRDTENTDNTATYHPTPLETSSLSLIELYINHYSSQARLEFLQKSKISDPQTEEEAKKSITDALKEIKKETETVPFELMQQLLETKHRKKIFNNKKNTIQNIFAYIKEAEGCDKIALYQALSIKPLMTQHEHNQPKELYKYNEKFINNKENTQAIEKTIQVLLENFIFLKLLGSSEQKNEDSQTTNTKANYHLNPHKISTTQQIIKTIILSLMQAQDISYINIVRSFNLTLEHHDQLIKEFQGPDSLWQITNFTLYQTYSETIIPLIIRKYEPIIQQIAQEQKTYFTDNETTIPEEQSATIETETRTENIKHSQTPINLQATTRHTPSSKQEQPKAQQLIATTQKRKRKSKHLLDTEHETPRKKQYENTSQQNPPTLITETTIAQQNKVAHSQR